MTQMNMLFGALFRPRPTFARLAEGVKWAWIPAVLVVLAASLANVVVTVPLSTKAMIEFGEREAARQQQEADGRGRPSGRVRMGTGVSVEEEAKSDAEDGSATGPEEGVIVTPSGGEEDAMSALAMTSGLVFGAVGVLASLLATATFFFVAGKVWAKRVVFGTYVSTAALAAMPLAARDILQTAYQAITGTWIQHQGIASLVAAKDAPVQGGFLYGLLMQVDVWSIWALVLLFIGIQAAATFERKRALMALGIFTALTVVLRAAPVIVTGLFSGAAG